MENGNKKNSVLTSLGAKLAALKTFYGWVARVAIVCIHVDECPAQRSVRVRAGRVYGCGVLTRGQ